MITEPLKKGPSNQVPFRKILQYKYALYDNINDLFVISLITHIIEGDKIS